MTGKRLKPIKLDDLAKELGVSKVTVSKALRNHPDISPATRMRVKELAEKLGYIPNYMAKNLSSRKSNIIGLVVPKIAHLFFGAVIESIYDTAFQNNYETIITVSGESVERERKHILSLLSMRVDGLIISITQETRDTAIFKRAQQLNVPMVFIDRIPNLKKTASITVDDRGGAFNAVEDFIRSGIQNIGHIGGYSYINIGQMRKQGFIDAMNKHNLTVNDNWVVEGGFGEEDGYKGFMKMFKKGPLPEAILAVTYPVALGMYEAAIEMGVNIPQDVKVTCFGNNTYKRTLPSIFSFVDQPTEELGREAVKLMIDLIDNPARDIQKNIELKTRLVSNGNGISLTQLA